MTAAAERLLIAVQELRHLDLAPVTLYERMRAEVEANGSVIVGRFEVGGWSRLQQRG